MINKSLFASIIFILAIFCFDTTAFSQRKKKSKKIEQPVPPEQIFKAEQLFIKGEANYLLDDYNAAIHFFEQSLKLTPKDDYQNIAAINFKLAQCNFALGEANKAINLIEKAIELAPQISEYHLTAIKIHIHQENFKKATSAYENLISQNPNKAMFRFDAASLYIDIVDRERIIAKSYSETKEQKKLKSLRAEIDYNTLKAIEHLIAFEKIYGVDPDISGQISKLYLSINQTENAIIEIEKLSNAFPEDVSHKIHIAQIYYLNGNTEKAIATLENLNDSIPNTYQAKLLLSDYYTSLNQYEKANQILASIFQEQGLPLDQKIEIITEYIRSGNNQQLNTAESLAKTLTKNYPNDAKVFSLYGDILYLNKKTGLARDSYYQSVKIDSSKKAIWQQVILLDVELEDNSALLVHTTHALQNNNDEATFWFYNGIALLLDNNKEASVNSFEQTIKNSPNNPQLSEQSHTQLGDLYHELGDKEKSYKAYEEALILNPNSIHVLNNYSYFLSLDKTDLEKAKSMSKKTILMNPNDATYLDTYAWILYQLEDYSQAKKYLEKAIKNSNDGTILEHYGDTLFKLGEKKEAINYWKKAKTKGGTSDLIDKKIQDENLYE